MSWDKIPESPDVSDNYKLEMGDGVQFWAHLVFGFLWISVVFGAVITTEFAPVCIPKFDNKSIITITITNNKSIAFLFEFVCVLFKVNKWKLFSRNQLLGRTEVITKIDSFLDWVGFSPCFRIVIGLKFKRSREQVNSLQRTC